MKIYIVLASTNFSDGDNAKIVSWFVSTGNDEKDMEYAMRIAREDAEEYRKNCDGIISESSNKIEVSFDDVIVDYHVETIEPKRLGIICSSEDIKDNYDCSNLSADEIKKIVEEVDQKLEYDDIFWDRFQSALFEVATKHGLKERVVG